MEVKTKAIVLRTVRYGDSRMIVDMLTASVGRVSFACGLSKTNRGKIKKQLFQPLTLLDIVFDYRPTMELQRIKDVRMARPFVSIPFDAYKMETSLKSSRRRACCGSTMPWTVLPISILSL